MARKKSSEDFVFTLLNGFALICVIAYFGTMYWMGLPLLHLGK